MIKGRVSRVIGQRGPKSVAPPQKSKILKSSPKCAPGCCGTELLWQDHDWLSSGSVERLEVAGPDFYTFGPLF